jgi:phosphatidylglycerol:prolipoprotein diacylglycerol transferase
MTNPGYGFFLASSLVLFFLLGLLFAWRRGFSPGKTAVILSLVVFAALVGARLWNLITNPVYYGGQPDAWFQLHLTGFSLYGGLLLGAGTGLLLTRLFRWSPLRLADALIPAVGVAIAVAKVGCFFNGCCYGLPTDLPWGVTYPSGSLPYLDQFSRGWILFSAQSLPVHPTQLYEALAGLLGSAGAFWLLNKKLPDGVVFWAFVLWFSACRWLISLVRASGSVLPIRLWLDPVLYALLIAIAILMLVRSLRIGSRIHTSMRFRPARPELKEENEN